MPDNLDCMVKIFADDTKAYSAVSTSEQHSSLQNNIDKLLKWTEDWQIKFNSSKCKVLHLGKNNPMHNYSMEGNVLETTDAEKDLGVYIDTALSFDHHINESVKKANRTVGMISRYVVNKNKEIMVPLFKSLVRPILEYGNAIWSPSLIRQSTKVENVQRRFTKRVIGIGDLDYHERLRRLNLPSLHYRRRRGDMIEAYKILHEMYDNTSSINDLLKINKSTTRGHPLKLTKQHVHTNLFKSFFTNRIINDWNSLPSSVVMSETINSFKTALDNEWKLSKFSI